MLLYHPVPTPAAQVAPPGSWVQDIDLEQPDGNRLHLRWCPVAGASGALLYCHGNAGNLSGRAAAVRDLMTGLGESVLIFDYPGYGRSGGKPSEEGCYAAAERAFDWLTQEKGIPPERIILFGKSLGGGVATELATRRPHRALVLVKTFTSVPDLGRELYSWVPASCGGHNRFDNLAKIGQCPGPVFIAHGDADRLIPYSHAEKLHAAAPEPKALYRIPGCGHNDPLPPDCLPALKQFLRDHAPVGGPPAN
jgi:fermentation-respiration switch protein FrsA (DUF1100 family)